MEHFNPVLGSPEYGRGFKERRKNMIEKIKRHEALLQDIRSRIEAVPNDAEPAEALAALDAIWAKTISDIDPQAVADWEESKRLREETEKVDARYEDVRIDEEELLAGDVDPERERIADETADLMISTINEFLAAKNKPDVILLDSLHSTLEMLRAKIPRVEELKKSHKKTLTALNLRLKAWGSTESTESKKGTTVKMREIEDIAYGRFEITLTLSESAFARLNRLADFDAAGWHLNGSPFSLVVSANPKKAETFRHESVHNLLDGKSFGTTRFMLKELENFGTYSSSKHEYLDLIKKKQLFRLSSTECLDNLKEELLAELEHSERREFGLSPENAGLPDEHLGRMATTKFSTAGATVREFLDSAARIAKTTQDPEIREFLADFSKKLKLRFLEMARSLRTAFAIADRLPDSVRAHDAMINLCLMLRPSQYANLPMLAREMFGQDDCRDAERSFDFGQLVLKDDWTKLVDLPTPPDLHPKDIGLIADYLRESDPYQLAENIITKNDVTTLPHLHRLLARFGELEGLIGRSPETDEVKDKIAYKFFDEILEGSLNLGFKPIVDLYPLLEESEKEPYEHALDVYFGGEFLSEDLASKLDTADLETWRGTIDWAFFDKLGFGDRMRGQLDEAIKNEKETDAKWKAPDLSTSPFSSDITPEQLESFREIIFGMSKSKKPKKK